MVQKIALIIIMAGIVSGAAYMGVKVHTLSDEQGKIRQDYSVINNITYGLLSVNKWRDVILASVNHRTETFKLTKEQEAMMKAEINQILHSLINKAVSMINAKQTSIGGKLKKFAFNTFVDVDNIHAQVPVFAQQILNEVKSPTSTRRLKSLASSKLKQLSQQTYDSTLQATQPILDSILVKNGVADRETFQKRADAELKRIDQEVYKYTYLLLACIPLVLLIWLLVRTKRNLHTAMYIMSVLLAVVLLVVGVTTSMIEIDARIQSLDFKIIGEKVTFENQVLFYQSKSILNVVHILIETGKFDSVAVGVLILIFSIAFPFAKLFSTGIYLLINRRWAHTRVIEYFAFKSGKWSMADVMVVAIFMAYIGFNSILTEQLSNLNVKSEGFNSISTNQTSLQPGYIVFVCFVVYSLIMSSILKRISKKEPIAVSANPNIN